MRPDDVIAIHDACESASVALSRSLGPTGCHAVLTRAVLQAKVAHPFLGEVRIGREPEPSFGGIADLVEVHGARAVGEALAHTLEFVLMLLSRLIGLDVVAQLVEPRSSLRTQTDGTVK